MTHRARAVRGGGTVDAPGTCGVVLSTTDVHGARRARWSVRLDTSPLPRPSTSDDETGATMAYSVSPDGPTTGAFDPEAGATTGSTMVKGGDYREFSDAADRTAERAGARNLDTTVEALPALTRARRDLERAFPRSATGEVPVRRRRELPIPDAIRVPISAWQRNARSRAKNTAQTQLPAIGYAAVRSLISDQLRWDDTGAALSAAVGDAQQLDDSTRKFVQRIDRAIRTAETGNDRSHVLYCAARLPHPVPDAAADLPTELHPGSAVVFDRFTLTAHDLHQLDPHLGGDDVIFEIATARGMYLGRSDKIDDTTHLLPRALRFDVVSAGEGRYRRPDGTIGRRMIVQLRDTTEGQ